MQCALSAKGNMFVLPNAFLMLLGGADPGAAIFLNRKDAEDAKKSKNKLATDEHG